LSRGTITSQLLPQVLILADDLTGAADSAAAFVGRARSVSVLLQVRARSDSDVVAIDLDTRSRPERTARAVAKRALASRAAKRARILFKKIDSTLRGHVSAELASVRRTVVFAPAFPAQGRTVRQSRLHVNGRMQPADLRPLLARAGLPATGIDLAAVRRPRLEETFRAAIAIGAHGLVCDAQTDADLDRIARAGLALRPRPLFVGSAGLARALARTLSPRRSGKPARAERRPVITVVGSASPVSARQAQVLARDPASVLVQIAWRRTPTPRDIPAVRRVGRVVAEAAPRAHYVLTGGETARAVLDARGISSYRLRGEVEPGVPFGMADDGTLICTKAGAFGGSDTLARCVRRLRKEMK
jgi:uncharacterized protein YgbK (DUF1537 family)